MSHHWQASGTYLWSGQWNKQVAPVAAGCQYPTIMSSPGTFVCNVPFQLAPDIAEEWYLSADQRKRATLNGIVEMGYGFQVSGTYLYGDNGWATPTSGVDVRQTGGSGGRLLPNGTLIARNSFDIPSIHKVDMRLQRRFNLGRQTKIDGIVEVYNVFNHQNLATYTTNLSNASTDYRRATPTWPISRGCFNWASGLFCKETWDDNGEENQTARERGSRDDRGGRHGRGNQVAPGSTRSAGGAIPSSGSDDR